MSERIPKIVVVGPAYVDVTVRCENFPSPGETCEGSGFSCVPTGFGVNRSIQAALCGCDVFLLARVGEDCFGQMIRGNLQRFGVSTDLVFESQAISTGAIVTMVDGNGENRSCRSEAANKVLGRDEIEYAAAEQTIGSANVCLVSDQLTPSAVVSALRTAKLHKTRTILEAFLPIPDRAIVYSLNWPMEYYNADILVLHFEGLLCGSELGSGGEGDLKFIGTELVAKGANCVVISLGWRGGLIIDRQGPRHIAGIQTDVVDPTGCEDAFGGALAASFGTGDSPTQAVRFALAAEALSRSRFGLQDALPVREEIISLLQEQPD
jgi:ribokinase